MREIIINKVTLNSYKAPLDIDPQANYKLGAYLDIEFEIKKYVGYRTQTEYRGTLSHKMTKPRGGKPFCRMSYDELESLAYQVIKEEMGKEI